MKTMLLAAACTTAALASYGQSDSTHNEATDTIRIGNMTIIKKKNGSTTTGETNSGNTVRWTTEKKKAKRVATSWMNFDFGFSNFTDNTNYGSAAAQAYARPAAGAPAFGSGDFNLRNAKSVNVNLWIIRQRAGITKNRVLHVSYGLMLEMNNYRFDTDLKTTYAKGNDPHVFRDNKTFKKNKLALDYVTLPLMLGIDTKPNGGGFSLSAGVSVGYLYSSRNKQISTEDGKQKIKGNFDIEPWKFQYIGEVGLGPIMLYGSYAPKSMYKTGLDHAPYNIGLRFGDWDKL